MRDVGPPDGVERRRRDRRVADRRRGAERRRGTRRADGSVGGQPAPRIRASVLRPTHARNRYAKLAQYRAADGRRRARTPRILRALLITAIALGCLLAGTVADSRAATAPKAPKGKAGVIVKSSGTVRASLSYVRTGTAASGGPRYGALRLTVRAPGRTALRRLLISGRGSTGYLTRPQLTLREVTGDGIPDALVDVFTGGAHCCAITTLVRSTPKSWNRSLVTRDWADHGYRLVDAGGSATPEFVTDDARFTGAYTAYATSASPIRILSAEGGLFRDVTTGFPDWIRTDVKRWEQAWQSATQERDPVVAADIGRAAAAAWIADLALLGEFDAAKAVYVAAQGRGDFANASGFGGQLGHDLTSWGYVADPASIGLTDAPTG